MYLGATKLPNSFAHFDFEREIVAWFDTYFNEGFARRQLQVAEVQNMTSAIDVIEQNVMDGGNTINYTQSMRYRALSSSRSPKEYAVEPYEDETANTELVGRLKQNVAGFENLVGPIATPVIDDASVNDGGLSAGAIVGIVIVIAVFTGLLFGLFLVVQRKRNQEARLPSAHSSMQNDVSRPINGPTAPDPTAQRIDDDATSSDEEVAARENATRNDAFGADDERLPRFKDQVQSVEPRTAEVERQEDTTRQPLRGAKSKDPPEADERLPRYKDQVRAVEPRRVASRQECIQQQRVSDDEAPFVSALILDESLSQDIEPPEAERIY